MHVELTDNARTAFMQRYTMKDSNRNPIETPEDVMWRVAETVSKRGERSISVESSNRANRFYDELLQPLNFLPNSPTFTGAGTPLGQLAACFVLPIEDDMGGHPDGIFSALRNAALIQKTGGGNGFSFSRLRPRGALIESSKGIATGPVGFLRVFNAAFKEISQGGSRRGANMAVLRVDHPDIEEFIECKSKEGDIDNFNISVGITDEFMVAVENNLDFPLRFGNKIYRTVRAKELMKKIAINAHTNGEPGVLFLDAANAENPVPNLYELEATNPCGEQWLGPYENCCLGSINLANHLTKDDNKHNPDHQVDWEKLMETTRLATEFLDCVIDANAYVEAVPQLREAALDVRRIGLGVMGFADILYKLGVRYGSEDAETVANKIMAFIRYHSIKRSIELAKELGRFRKFEGSIYTKKKLNEMLPPFAIQSLGKVTSYDYSDLQSDLDNYGIRNGAQLTVAPTGTISTVASCEGYGCEPVFALGYIRHMVGKNGEDIELEYLSPLFEEELSMCLKEGHISEWEHSRLRYAALNTGTIRGLTDNWDHRETVSYLQNVFVTSMDVNWSEHIRMQAAFQVHVDNSLSKTINMPNDAVWQDVEQAYIQAWESGCKGLTVYRTGSRDQVVLETRDEKSRKLEGDKSKVFAQAMMSPPPKQPREQVLTGKTYKQVTPAGIAYVTINEVDGEPFEVFITLGKGGSEVNAVCEAIGRNISLVLRMASPVPRVIRLGWIMDELSGIGGGRSTGFGMNRVTSIPDGVAKALGSYLSQEEMIPALQDEPAPYGIRGDICPECGNSTLIDIEGCRKCIACGYSEC